MALLMLAGDIKEINHSAQHRVLARHTSTVLGVASSKRVERRKAAREQERRRAEEIERVLDEPQQPPFEAPPTGKIVERSIRPQAPKKPV
ncbi:MAG: hypothetical protein V2A73_16835 [Pseudomonadota bacterium]